MIDRTGAAVCHWTRRLLTAVCAGAGVVLVMGLTAVLVGCSEAESRLPAGERAVHEPASTGQAAARGKQDGPSGLSTGSNPSSARAAGGQATSARQADGSARDGAPPGGQQAPTPPAGGARDITFDDVKFDLQPGQPFQRAMLGPKIEQLAGTRIRVRGYIHPQSVFTLTDITAFVLVRDNQQCCFGPGAMLYDSMMVYMQAGRTTNFTDRPITVEGVFRIEELVGPDGKHYSIYRVDAVSAG